jgi:hypothetical protein
MYICPKTILLQNKLTRYINGTTVFCTIWLLVFALYFPAAKAGFVADFTGWLDQVRNHTFREHINRTNFQVHSLYQFTQFVTWIFYQLFGVHEWLWHLLFITLHVINATLLYKLTSRLLADAGSSHTKSIAFIGTLLFSVSPYISEVLVWEPSFHFLQGLLFILVVLLCVQNFLHTGEKRNLFIACIVYFLSTFALEIFYITPWLVLSMILFYRGHGTFSKYSRPALQFVFAPLLAIFFLRFALFRIVYGSWVSRIGSGAVTSIDFTTFSKPVKYVFHLMFLGRFFAHTTRQKIYSLCEQPIVIVVFYITIALITAYILFNFRKMTAKARVASLLFVWTMITLLLLIPLWFPDILLSIYDRYTYFTDAFFYTLLTTLAFFITASYVRASLLLLFGLINTRFTIKVNRYWWKSEKIIYSLLHNIPQEPNKTIILLNIPQSMHGIAMIGAEKDSEYKMLHDLLLPGQAFKTTVYDAMAYNMETPEDGAHVTVINDSTVKVTLNQWGTWWWYETMGGHSYENADYNLAVTDPGHEYVLTLKKPASSYLVLFQVSNKWRKVDWNKKNTEQF